MWCIRYVTKHIFYSYNLNYLYICYHYNLNWIHEKSRRPHLGNIASVCVAAHSVGGGREGGYPQAPKELPQGGEGDAKLGRQGLLRLNPNRVNDVQLDSARRDTGHKLRNLGRISLDSPVCDRHHR